jgi:hypothetical protein
VPPGSVSRRDLLALLALSPAASMSPAGLRAAQRPRTPLDFRKLAPAPPMGWNSWDSFGPAINEEAARANAGSDGQAPAAAWIQYFHHRHSMV